MKYCVFGILSLIACTACSDGIYQDANKLCKNYKPQEYGPIQIYDGEIQFGNLTLDTALLITSESIQDSPEDDRVILVYYMWGMQPKMGARKPGCHYGAAIWEDNTLRTTFRTIRQKRKVSTARYVFSDDRKTAERKKGESKDSTENFVLVE